VVPAHPMLSLGMLFTSYNIAWSDSDKDYCYEQVSDGHFRFDSKHTCRQEQKNDEIAGSPRYKED
jgi:hypothetical protein